MGLYSDWSARLEKGDKAAQDYIKVYYEKEKNAYADILSKQENTVSGTVTSLAERFKMEPAEICGFIDGINTSLSEQIDVKELSETSEVTLNIIWEKLYENMLRARAPWLYGLEEWAPVLSDEQRSTITRNYHISMQAVSHKISRNAPCPCGSGKKYKNCCGK